MIFNLVTLVAIILIILVLQPFFTVKTQTAVIIERFSKFARVVQPGLHVKIPLIERIATRVSMQVQQLDFQVETKTKDNVTVTPTVRVQYSVLPDEIATSYYKLENPRIQIQAYVNDALLTEIPGMTLDDTFSLKDEIAQKVKQALDADMKEYGYNIVRTLITEITMPPSVNRSLWFSFI